MFKNSDHSKKEHLEYHFEETHADERDAHGVDAETLGSSEKGMPTLLDLIGPDRLKEQVTVNSLRADALNNEFI